MNNSIMFVYRNNTIERFFPKEWTFSGYDDISYVPSDVDGYVWFYQLPLKFNQQMLAEEVKSYIQKFTLLLSQIPSTKVIVAEQGTT